MKKFITAVLVILSLMVVINTSFAQEKPTTQKESTKQDQEQSTKKKTTKSTSDPVQLQSWPVMFEGEVVFYINVANRDYSAEKRAQVITKNLARIAKEVNYNADKFKTVNEGKYVLITADSDHLYFVTPEDAEAVGETIDNLAKYNLKKIQTALTNYKIKFSPQHLAVGILKTIVTTLLFLFIISIFSLLINFLSNKVDKLQDEKVIGEVKFQKLNILTAKKVDALIRLLFIIIHITIIIVFLYIYIVLVLGFFPWTTTQSAFLYNNISFVIGKILSPVVLYLPNIFIILIISIFSYFVIKISKFIFTEIKRETIRFKWFEKEWSNTTHNIITFLTICFALALIYPYLPGSHSNAFKGVSIFVGLLVSIGSSSAVSNIIAGVILTYTNAFNHGERVQIGDFSGDVVDRNMFVVRIRTIKNEIISIPNSKVLNTEIKNYSYLARTSGLIIHTSVTIGYEVPWQNIHKALIEAALNTENVIKDKSPFVLQKSLDDYYVNYEINAYIDSPYNMMNIYSALHQNIQDKFNEVGIEILSPHYSSLRDGNKSTTSKDYLSEGYTAPPFNVNLKKDE